jgi:hypothetical protein
LTFARAGVASEKSVRTVVSWTGLRLRGGDEAEAEGIRCWIAPRAVMPGMEWGGSIIETNERSKITVLIFSANANASPQIRREGESLHAAKQIRGYRETVSGGLLESSALEKSLRT